MSALCWKESPLCAETSAGLYQIITLDRLSPTPTYKPQFLAKFTLAIDRSCAPCPTIEKAKDACERHHETGTWQSLPTAQA